MSAHKTAINLLPKTEFETSFWGRFLKWSLSTGRYIIILTEMVVILAFLSRFKLDKDLLDLNDSISGKKNILVATYSIEQNFRSAQTRINQAKELLAIQPSSTTILDKLTSNTPSGVSFQTLSVSHADHTIGIGGSALSEQQLGRYISTLTQDKIWKQVEVANLQSDDTGVKFIIKLIF